MNGLVRGMLSSISGFFIALFLLAWAVLTIPSAETLEHSQFLSTLICITILLVAIVAELTDTPRARGQNITFSDLRIFDFNSLRWYDTGQISAEIFSMIVFDYSRRDSYPVNFALRVKNLMGMHPLP